MKHHSSGRALGALVVLAALAAATLTVNAQTPPNGPPPGPGMYGDRLPASDAEFVRALDAGNTAELDIAKYVVNRTQDAAIHAFAQHMIDDHSSTAVQLEAVTRGTNLRPTPRETETNGMGRRALAMLQADSGSQLDNDFMRLQVPLHRRTLALLQWESQNGQNTGLKQLADKQLPTVQQHLQLAQNYLADHNLTPFSPPMTNPVPGNVNPNGTGASGSNNPASGSNGGSTSGSNNGSSGSPTPAPAVGPVASPAPSASPMA